MKLVWSICIYTFLVGLPVVVVGLYYNYQNLKTAYQVQEQKEIHQKRLIRQLYQRLEDDTWEQQQYAEGRASFYERYQEVDLSKGEQDANAVYRLTYWSAFCPTLFVYTINNYGDSSFQLVRTYLKISGCYPDTPRLVSLEKDTFLFGAYQWQLLEDKANHCMFWSLEYLDDKGGKDGYSFTLEAVFRRGHYKKYQVVRRWWPHPSYFDELCRWIRAQVGEENNHCYPT